MTDWLKRSTEALQALPAISEVTSVKQRAIGERVRVYSQIHSTHTESGN